MLEHTFVQNYEILVHFEINIYTRRACILYVVNARVFGVEPTVKFLVISQASERTLEL